MAKLVNKPQSIRAGVIYPSPGYSRVIGCKQNYMAPVGWHGMWTHSVGQSFWLLGVDVWLWVFNPIDPLYHRIDLRTGYGSPRVGADIEPWDKLVGFYDGTEPGDIELYATEAHIQLDMNIHFEGQNRRFGVRVYVGSGTHTVVNAAFRISEG